MYSKTILFVVIVASILFDPGALAHQRSWPGKRLSETLPSVKKFVQKQVSLLPAQIQTIEASLGASIGTEDKNPVFYQATAEKGETMGFVVFVDGRGPNGNIEMGVAVDEKGKVLRVALFDHSESASVESDKFLSQFIGKTAAQKFKAGEDIQAPQGDEKAAQAVALAVKRGALLAVTALGLK